MEKQSNRKPRLFCKEFAEQAKMTGLPLKKFLIRINELEAIRENHEIIHRKKLEHWLRMYRIIWLLRRPSKSGQQGILDVGCGDGHYLVRIAEIGYNNLIGLDVVKTRLCRAKKRLSQEPKLRKSCNLVLGDCENLPFKKRVFGHVLCCELLEHLADPRWAVKEIEKVIQEKGTILISVPNAPIFWVLLMKIRKMEGWRTFSDPITHIREYSFFKLNGYTPLIHLKRMLMEKFFVKRVLGVHLLGINTLSPSRSILAKLLLVLNSCIDSLPLVALLGGTVIFECVGEKT